MRRWRSVLLAGGLAGGLVVAGVLVPTAAGSAPTRVDVRLDAGARPGEQFGLAVDAVPDADADGVTDVLVGGPADAFTGSGRGRAVLFAGVDGHAVLTVMSPDTAGETTFGSAVAGVQDVTGDGSGDLVVGDRGFSQPSGGDRWGRVYLFDGRSGALLHRLEPPVDRYDSGFGAPRATDGVPDVDGDGRGDVLVGAERLGDAFLYSGRTGERLRTIAGSRHFGASVEGLEDLNGDGRGDLAVANTGDGSGLGGTVTIYSGATGEVVRILDAPGSATSFGADVAEVPDADGDGSADLAVAAAGSREVFLFSGTTGALLDQWATGRDLPLALAGADVDADGVGDVLVGAPFAGNGSQASAGRLYVLTAATTRTYDPGRQQDALFGSTVAGLGDVDADGRDDFVVGAGGVDGCPGLPDAGGALLVRSGGSALVEDALEPVAGPAATGEVAGAIRLDPPDPRRLRPMGDAVGAVPDVDADGVDDIVAGAAPSDRDLAGAAHLYSGASGALLVSVVQPAALTGQFGLAVAGVPDADGDGRGDIVVAAPPAGGNGSRTAGFAALFSGRSGALLHDFRSPDPATGQVYARSVAGVPDVDGDGRGDVVVGSTTYDNTPGAAHVYSGRTGALLRTLRSPGAGVLFTSTFGWSLAGAPDIDGDDRGDVLVVSPGETPKASYLFSGASGAVLHHLVGSQGYYNGPVSAAAAVPDADGDGVSDLAVGLEAQYAPGGTVDLFSGADGSRLQNWRGSGSDTGFGGDLAGVPDVDGDGLGEVAVGTRLAPGGGVPGSGAVQLFTGSGELVVTAPGGEPGAGFGSGVAGLGDVNGDGRGDLAVGASGEDTCPGAIDAGAAYVLESSSALASAARLE